MRYEVNAVMGHSWVNKLVCTQCLHVCWCCGALCGTTSEAWGSQTHTHLLQHIGGIVVLWVLAVAYLLGLLAMIKCSICSYQCDN